MGLQCHFLCWCADNIDAVDYLTSLADKYGNPADDERHAQSVSNKPESKKKLDLIPASGFVTVSPDPPSHF